MNILNRSMSEAALQNSIIEAAERLNFLWHHETDSRKSNPGFPDLHIVGHGRHLVLELKTAKGPIRPEQKRWIEEYQMAGVDARIVRPDDLTGIIEELQQGLPGTKPPCAYCGGDHTMPPAKPEPDWGRKGTQPKGRLGEPPPPNGKVVATQPKRTGG